MGHPHRLKAVTDGVTHDHTDRSEIYNLLQHVRFWIISFPFCRYNTFLYNTVPTCQNLSYSTRARVLHHSYFFQQPGASTVCCIGSPMASPTSTLRSDPTTPVIDDGTEWIAAYLIIHIMSEGSKRYAYLLWFAVGLIFFVFAILHLTGSRGGFIGAYWSKWALRRRTWRGKYTIERAKRRGERPQPISLPPNGQLLCLAVLPVAVLGLSFIGPDYISPTSILSKFGRSIETRSESPSFYKQFQPQYTIHKAWWTVGGRTGIVAFAVLPLCILFALKAPPFALFALPFTTQIHFDKLAWLHRWSGRLIWFITSIHVATWSIQLFIDHREGTGKMAYKYAWLHKQFVFGWIVSIYHVSPFFLFIES